MDDCPVCLESFDLEEHVPKSLDCRHAVCAECVMNPHGPPLQGCPVCRQEIINRSVLPNDLSIIAWLEKKKQKRYWKKRREKIKSMIELVLEASEDVDRLLKEDTVSTAQTVEERSAIFNSYLKRLFEVCQQRCNSKDFLSDAVTKKRKKLEKTPQELETSMVACTSLLDTTHVTTDEIDRCESQALNAVKNARESVKSRVSYEDTWISYRQLVMEIFAEISKVPPQNDWIPDTGYHPSHCLCS